MTDDTPSPTTRMPVPEPGQDSPTQGWPGATLTDEPPAPGSGPVPPAGGSAEPPPAVSAAVPPSRQVPSPSRRADRDHGRTASILFGLVFLGLGLWFFVDHTLGYELPRIRWSQLWPAVLIVIGIWVVLGSMRRGSR
jgi:hypothetical protein